MAGGKSTLVSETQRIAEEITSTKADLTKFKKIAKNQRAKHGGQGKFFFLIWSPLPIPSLNIGGRLSG